MHQSHSRAFSGAVMTEEGAASRRLAAQHHHLLKVSLGWADAPLCPSARAAQRLHCRQPPTLQGPPLTLPLSPMPHSCQKYGEKRETLNDRSVSLLRSSVSSPTFEPFPMDAGPHSSPAASVNALTSIAGAGAALSHTHARLFPRLCSKAIEQRSSWHRARPLPPPGHCRARANTAFEWFTAVRGGGGG